jgi:hypothetical protein
LFGFLVPFLKVGAGSDTHLGSSRRGDGLIARWLRAAPNTDPLRGDKQKGKTDRGVDGVA